MHKSDPLLEKTYKVEIRNYLFLLLLIFRGSSSVRYFVSHVTIILKNRIFLIT